MTEMELDDVLAVYRDLWKGSAINQERANIWWIAIGSRDKDRTIEAIRDYAASSSDYKPPAPGRIRAMLNANAKQQVDLEPTGSMPPRNPRTGEFWADMGVMSAPGTTPQRKAEIQAKWRQTDETDDIPF
jgi:hypothetical protein